MDKARIVTSNKLIKSHPDEEENDQHQKITGLLKRKSDGNKIATNHSKVNVTERNSFLDSKAISAENEEGKRRKIIIRKSAISNILSDTVRSRERQDAEEKKAAQLKLKNLENQLGYS